jgi:hypothetical protein
LAQAFASVDRRREKAVEQITYRKKAQGEGSNLLALQERIRRLRDELAKAEKSRVSPHELITQLSALFVETLKSIRFPALEDARIDDQTYLPYVRNQPYPELQSKGAISLCVVAWHLGLLQYALNEHSRFPMLLMLDSPLNHVGHDSADPGFKDQQLVDAFYDFLWRLHSTRAKDFQLIICDNRPPASAEDMIAVRFTRDPALGRFGLIDDEHPPGLEESATDKRSVPTDAADPIAEDEGAVGE